MRFYKFKTIAGRINSGYLVVILLLVMLLIFVGIFSFNYTRQYNVLLDSIIKANNIHALSNQHTYSIIKKLGVAREEIYNSSLETQQQIENNIVDLKKIISKSKKSRIYLDGIINLVNTYFEMLKEISNDRSLSMSEVTEKYNEVRKINGFIDEEVKKFAGVQLLESRVIKEEINNRALLTQITSLIIIIIIIILSFIFALTIAKDITKTLNKIIDNSSNIAGGNYEVGSIIIDSRDELRSLAEAFNIMTSKIKTNFSEIKYLKSYLANIIESMPSVLIAIDEAGTVTQWNHAAMEFTGINETEALGKNLYDLAPFLCKFKRHCDEIVTGHKKEEFHREQFIDDQTRFQDITLFPLSADSIHGIVLRIDDITEMEKKEEQLRQAQKMETIGTLAGGLAHDFNNVLGGILGSLSVLKRKLKLTETLDKKIIDEYLDLIGESGARAVDMVQQLLSLSRKHNLLLIRMDLNDSLKNIMKLCTNTFDKSIDISFNFYKQNAVIKGDPTQIEQVLLNLCINAEHAMTIMRKPDEKQGGNLIVDIQKTRADCYFLDRHPEALEGNYWQISIRDTGIGIEKKILSKIFDPFFTTKEKGKGSGLGLAMVYNIIKQHNGFIDVYSEPGLGSSFNVYIPVLELKIVDYGIKEDLKMEKGDGLILVVDDEEIIRKIAGDILKECGYDVIYAVDGEEAIEIYREKHNLIKGVLLDMAMPKKSGKECFVELKRINNDVKVIVCSGFRKDERVEDVLKLGVKDFIQKPYTFEKLSKAINLLFS